MQPIEYIDGGVRNAIGAVVARHLAPVHLDSRSKVVISGRVASYSLLFDAGTNLVFQPFSAIFWGDCISLPLDEMKLSDQTNALRRGPRYSS